LILRSFYIVQQTYAQTFDILLKKQESYPILMFGDSAVSASLPGDSEPTGIDQFIAQAAAQPVFLLQHDAYSPLVYQHYAAYLASSQHKPKISILPINLRTWAAEWGDRPSYQFRLAVQYIDFRGRGVGGGTMLLDWLLRSDEGRLDDAWATREVVTLSGKRIGPNSELQRRRDLLRFTEVFRDRPICSSPQSDRNHCQSVVDALWWHYGSEAMNAELVDKALLGTITILKDAGIEIVAYLAPINIQDAARLGGPDLVAAINDRVSRIKGLLAAQHIELLDLHAILPSDRFGDWSCLCEHLDELGRKQVAAQVAESVRLKLAE